MDTSTAPATTDRRTLASRLAGWASRHAAVVLVTAVIATAVLTVPFLAMAPDEFASQEPEGPVFDARDQLQERFGAGVVGWFFIVEARDGEMLDRDSLLALDERVAALRADPTFGPMLVTRTDSVTGATSEGVVSLAGAIDGALASAGLGGLEDADDAVCGSS